MIRVPFRDVMEAILANCGQKFDGTLSDQQSILATFINLRVQEAHAFGPWSDMTLCEERSFADLWNSNQSFVIGDIVYLTSTAKYYEALTDNSNKSPDANATDWQANASPDRIIENEQYGAEKIGQVWKITNLNPRKNKNLRTFDFISAPTGTHILDCALNTVWVSFSNPSPRFTGKAWSLTSAANYKRGTIVFYPGTESDAFPNTGECYRADLDVDNNPIWVLVPFPEIYQRFVVSAASADMQRYYGKSEEATELKNEAYGALWEQARRNGIGPELTFSGR
jgi:hypothetical protein